MSLARHNSGNFAGYHAVNDPRIKNYDDAYSFLVENPDEFQLADAVRIHIFDVRLRKNIRNEERSNGHNKLDNDQIDRLVERIYGSSELKEVRVKAAQVLEEFEDNFEATAIREFASKLPKQKQGGPIRFSLAGAWQGFCGNLLTSVVIVAVAVSAFLYKDHEQVQDIANYLNTCVLFRDTLPGSKASSTAPVSSHSPTEGSR